MTDASVFETHTKNFGQNIEEIFWARLRLASRIRYLALAQTIEF